jgi:hypothetical protein
MQMDGWLERHDAANSHFRNFANAPKNKILTPQNHIAFTLKDQPANISQEINSM